MGHNAVSGCEGKHRFSDQGIAREVAKKASRRHECKMSCYECKDCGGYHIGERSQFQKPRKNGDQK